MQISDNLRAVEERIKRSCITSKIELSKVKILAVSKKMNVEKIQEAYNAGLNSFGENYASEGLEKIDFFRNRSVYLDWHFIGPIQSNKTKVIAENFDWVHSVSTLKVVKRLATQRPSKLGPINIFIQVNLSEEPNKSGARVNDLREIFRQLTGFETLQVRGLMTIPENTPDCNVVKDRFRTLKSLQQELRENFTNDNPSVFKFDMISMGMSGDLELAIGESDPLFTTIVRVGTGIFGSR